MGKGGRGIAALLPTPPPVLAEPGAAGASCPVVTRDGDNRRSVAGGRQRGVPAENASLTVCVWGGVVWGGSGSSPGVCRQASGRWG